MIALGLDPSFPKSAYHVSHAKDAYWDEGLRAHLKYRDLGMVDATKDKVRAHVIAPTSPCQGAGDLHHHALDFQMVYVLKGCARMQFEGIGEVRMEEGSCMYQEPGIKRCKGRQHHSWGCAAIWTRRAFAAGIPL